MKGSSTKRRPSKKVRSAAPAKAATSGPASFHGFTAFPSAYLLIAFLALAVYAQTLTFGFSGLDDSEYLIPGILATHGINAKEAFATGAFVNTPSEFYRPIQSLSLMLDAHFSGPKGTAYHFSNLLYHILTCATIFYLFVLLGCNRLLSLSLVMLYAVHPFLVHTVAWVPARGDLQIALFAVLSLIFLIHYYRSRSPLFLLLHTATFLLAVFAKETALLLPIVFLAHHLLIHRQDSLRSKVHALALPVAAWVIIVSAYSWLRLAIVNVHLNDTNFGAGPILGNLRTIPEFVAKFFAPLRLSPMPDFTTTNTWAGIVVSAVLLFVLVRFRQTRTRLVWFGVLWFLVLTLPSMSYRHEYGSAAYDYLEHRAYLPSIGLMIVLAELLQVAVKRVTPAFYIMWTAVVLSAAAYSFAYAQNYRDEMSFLTRAIVSNPGCALAYFNRGVMEARMNRFDNAFGDYQKAIEVKPDYSKAYNNRGIIRWMWHQPAEAMADYDAAYRYNPNSYDALFNRGYAKLLLNDREGGYADLGKAAEMERRASTR